MEPLYSESSMSTSESEVSLNSETQKEFVKSWAKVIVAPLVAAVLALAGWLTISLFDHLSTTTKLVLTVDKIEKHLDVIERIALERGFK